MKITKIKIIKDLFLNIIGSFILTGILQLLVYPFMSSQMSTDRFGSLLTLMGLSNAIGSIFGGSLNNIKLINQHNYEKNDFKDFYILLNRVLGLSLISNISIVLIYRNQIGLIEAVCLIISTLLLVLRNYMNVYYRINLDYNRIIIHIFITAVGYIIGLALFRVLGIWSVTFFSGELMAFIYAYKTTDFKIEKNIKSNRFNKVNKELIQLVSSNSISNLLLYLDRVIINPILGPVDVALYYIASLVGKTVGIILNPMASIILTYLSKINNISRRKIFYTLSITSIVMGTIIYIISIPITPVIIKILYASDFIEAQKYFNLANLSVILMICGSLINPILLKSAPMFWQNIIQIIYSMLYLGLSIVLMIRYELYGFCIAGIISNFIRFLLIEAIGYYYTAT
jgi:O-antigen/teichoic acid export membrane protein